MKARVIVLSGRVGAGKSTLAGLLRERIGAKVLKTKDLIAKLSATKLGNRRTRQLAGQRLDKLTGGRWVVDAVNERILSEANLELLVVDAARIPEQVRLIRQSGWSVVHVHLEASEGSLEERYKRRPANEELPSYRDVAMNWTEKHADALKDLADVVVNTDRCSAGDVFARVAARIEHRPVLSQPLVDVLIGGQYGSEGKGNVAHYLAPEYDVLVRVGGPNAGHKVFRTGQEPYTFRQLPSGALGNKEAKLVVGAGAVISLKVLLREIAELSVSYEKLLIDPQAMIISEEDEQWEIDNLKEAIGSTAQGIGAATARKIRHRKPDTDVVLAGGVPELKHFIRDTVEYFAECLSNGKRIMLEGTQGTSLSIHHGHYPHVTSRATTATACLAEAGLTSRHVRRVMMVCRTYPIRVGNTATGNTSGFMSGVIDFDEIARRSGLDPSDIKEAEVGSVSGRPRRVGEFDWAQVRRSALLNGPTDIALTFADYLGKENRKAFRYEQLNDGTLRFIEELEKVLGVPVSLISTNFSDRNIIDRRAW
jgi:adenylosuccinate synthase